MKVLITDDSAFSRLILKGMLKDLQITDFIEAPNADAALEAALNCSPDLILLDIHMPGMDGLSALQKLKDDPQTASVPVIMISSDATPEQMSWADVLGAAAYIRKPFRVELLRQAVVKATGADETVRLVPAG
ncbi:MAG TPA: response regulator [Planctomycetota bacterium]|jgi:two-component system chemotaxis response regulator CheY